MKPTKPFVFQKNVFTILAFAITLLFRCLLNCFWISQIFKHSIDKRIPPTLKKKIIVYSAIVPEIVGKPLLKESESKSEDRTRLYLSAGIIPLIDSLTDSFEKERNNRLLLKEAFNACFAGENKNPIVNNINTFFTKLKLIVPNPTELINSLEVTFNSQVSSLKQLDYPLNEELKVILKEKGGSAFLYYARIINPDLEPGDLEAIKQAGFFLQLINDLVDVDKDKRNSVETLATRLDIRAYNEFLNDQWVKTVEGINKMNISKKNSELLVKSIKQFAHLQMILKKS